MIFRTWPLNNYSLGWLWTRDIEVKRIFKKDKQTNNTISAALSDNSSGNSILAANNVIRATGIGNPYKYTFVINILTVKLDKISQ